MVMMGGGGGGGAILKSEALPCCVSVVAQPTLSGCCFWNGKRVEW